MRCNQSPLNVRVRCRGHAALGLIACMAAGCAKPSADQIATPDQTQLRPAAIQAHTGFLASDLLEGRESGTRGHDLAAHYVAAQFAAIGLAPGGEAGTYFQAVPLQKRSLVPGSVKLSITTPSGTRQFANGEDIAVDASALETDQSLEAAVVFAGFGIVAPELNHDDYAGLDVRGKIVATFASAPSSFPDTLRAHFGLSDHKAIVAASRGAIGMISLKTPSWEKISPWERTRRLLPLPQMTWVGADGTAHVPAPQLRASMSFGPKAAAALFEGAPQSLETLRAQTETGAPAGFPLKASISFARRSTHEIVKSPNVIGVLRGSDPVLKDEYLVVTSHLDHVGIGDPVDGDRIYNGAADNAVGIAIMLEVARSLAANASTVKRSIMFIATTAEEKGLLGSGYFADHPTVPLQRIAANINIDGMLAFYEFGDVVAYGAEHSTLGASMANAVRGTGVTLAPDPAPGELIFARSDQYPLVKKGVPALFVLTGFGPGSDGKSGKEITEWFLRAHYHQPSDEIELPWNWPAAARFADIYRRLILDVASSAQRPRWYEGDLFGEQFAAAAAKAPRP